jgi:hypothetical protein
MTRCNAGVAKTCDRKLRSAVNINQTERSILNCFLKDSSVSLLILTP